MPRPTLRLAFALLLGGLASVACGGGDGGGPNPVATAISVTPVGPLTLTSGTTQQLSATVLDQDGHAMSGVAVTWQSSLVTVASVSGSGGVSAALAGTTIISAHVGAVASNGVQVSVTPGAASQIQAIGGAAQSGKSVGSVADTLIARVTDAAGNPVAGSTIDWLVTTGTGTLAIAQNVTSGTGTAHNLLTLGTTPGPRIVRATINGTATQVQFGITAIAGPAVTLSVGNHFVVLDSAATSTTLWTAQDAYGNPATLSNVLFTSRGPAAVSVNLGGAVTGLQRGNTIIVADLPGVATDSVDVLVAIPGAPALITDLQGFGLSAGGSLQVTIVMDMRNSGEAFGSSLLQLDWDPALLTYQSDSDAGNGLGATVNATGAAGGTLLLAAASANGLSGAVAIRTITFQVAPGVGLTGMIPLTLSTSEVRAALTFRDLLAHTVAGTYPLVTQ